jgi:hypothetical protein
MNTSAFRPDDPKREQTPPRFSQIRGVCMLRTFPPVFALVGLTVVHHFLIGTLALLGQAAPPAPPREDAKGIWLDGFSSFRYDGDTVYLKL